MEYQSVGVEGERQVPVDVAEHAVPVPAVGHVVLLDPLDGPLCGSRVARSADPFPTHVDQQPEELPVVGCRLELVDSVQPCQHPLLRPVAERVPEVLGGEGNGEADGRHLDHPLVGVPGAGPPVLLAVRVGTGDQALAPPVPVVEVPATDNQGHDPVERSGIPLQLGHPPGEQRCTTPQADPGAAR